MGFNAWILFQRGIQFRKYLKTNKKKTTNSWRLLLNNWNELPLYIIIVWHNATKEQQQKTSIESEKSCLHLLLWQESA